MIIYFRHSRGLQGLGYTMKASYKELALILMFVGIGIHSFIVMLLLKLNTISFSSLFSSLDISCPYFAIKKTDPS